MRKLDYDYCHAAPILEWMSRKWALVTLLRIEEMSSNENESVRFGDLFRSIPHISEKMLACQYNPRIKTLSVALLHMLNIHIKVMFFT